MTETNWLDYLLILQGLKPWKKKVEAILHMDCLCNSTELCCSLGASITATTCGTVCKKAGGLLLSQAVKAAAKLYHNGEKMLSIVATLKEFHGMLLGADLHVFTDHNNLTFDSIKN
ncbi:hypothetical protein ACHAW6_008458 [Cyclotella cf. meneghiniana]